MTNVFSFNTSNFDKFFVGSDKIIDNLSKVQQAASKALAGYPPYNIVKVGDDKYVIEMAVAGFGKNDLEIELANNVLTVKGKFTSSDKGEETDSVTYLYKGIADRVFSRKFTLADTVEIKNAELINGMLKIWLENMIPEEKKPKKIEID